MRLTNFQPKLTNEVLSSTLVDKLLGMVSCFELCSLQVNTYSILGKDTHALECAVCRENSHQEYMKDYQSIPYIRG